MGGKLKLMLTNVVAKVVTREAIAADVRDLTNAYQAVIDAKGHYISSRVS
jgi:hypothetical protein